MSTLNTSKKSKEGITQGSSLKKTYVACCGAVALILGGFVVHRSEGTGFRQYLNESIGDDYRHYTKKVEHAIQMNCVGETGELITQAHPLFSRIQKSKEMVDERLSKFGVAPRQNISYKNIFICNIEPVGERCSSPLARVVSGTNIGFSNKHTIRNSTITHEIGHIGQNPYTPSWLKELVADISSGKYSTTRKGLYKINHNWGVFLKHIQSDLVRITYKKGDIRDELQEILTKGFSVYEDLPNTEKEKSVNMLIKSSPEQLLSYTIDLLEKSPHNSTWSKLLQVHESTLRSIRKRNICSSKPIDEEGLSSLWHDFHGYIDHVGVYVSMKLLRKIGD